MCFTNCFQSLFCCCSKRQRSEHSVCAIDWALGCFLRLIRRFTFLYLLSSSHNFFGVLSRKKIIIQSKISFVISCLLQLQDLYDSRTNLLTANGAIFNHETDVEIQPGMSFYVSGIILNNCEGYGSNFRYFIFLFPVKLKMQFIPNWPGLL